MSHIKCFFFGGEDEICKCKSTDKTKHKPAAVALLLFFLSLFCFTTLSAQKIEKDTTENTETFPSVRTPMVFLDCSPCDYNHVRSEITFVDYVRDPEMADIHVFVTDEETGNGGREYEFTYYGRGFFSGIKYTLKQYINRDATSEERREALNEYLRLGFASFVLQTPLVNRFSLDYEDNGDGSSGEAVEDPWNNWVFEIYAGGIELELESNQTEIDSRWGFYADRVTHDWKLRFRPYFNYDRVEIKQEEEETVISVRRRHGLDTYAIRSISDHWSIGLFGTYLTEDERNLKHRFRISPGIEYSLLPYEEATRKSITLTYQIGHSYIDYFEETIYGHIDQKLFYHELDGSVSILQPWGRIDAGVTGSHYLHDLDHRRLEFYGRLSVRLTEGLSLSFQTDYDVIQDQLALPAGGATLEEILLQQRELATDFSFSSSIAISYTFGSNFANIVNTRF